MTGEQAIRGIAAGAAAFGSYAAVTSEGWAALVAGLCAVLTAVLVLRSRPAPDAGPASPEEAVDQDGEPVDAASTPASPTSNDPAPTSAETSAQLLDTQHLDATIRGRIAVARRALRPLSVVHILIMGTDDGPGPVPAALMAAAAEATLRESDIVGRRDDGVYVVVLEDTGEDGAVWTTERLRRHVAGTIGPRRFQAGVASYPNHGLDAESVVANAADALRAAQEWDRDRIEVAVH